MNAVVPIRKPVIHRRWTADEDAALARDWAAGVRGKDIAASLDRTLKSVFCRALHLKLTTRVGRGRAGEKHVYASLSASGVEVEWLATVLKTMARGGDLRDLARRREIAAWARKTVTMQRRVAVLKAKRDARSA